MSVPISCTEFIRVLRMQTNCAIGNGLLYFDGIDIDETRRIVLCASSQSEPMTSYEMVSILEEDLTNHNIPIFMEWHESIVPVTYIARVINRENDVGEIEIVLSATHFAEFKTIYPLPEIQE